MLRLNVFSDRLVCKILFSLEMVESMKCRVQMCKEELSSEERNLLSVAYKNVAGQHRASWRILQSLREKECDRKDPPPDPRHMERIQGYINKIEQEMQNLYEELINLIELALLPSTSPKSEGHIFFLKMYTFTQHTHTPTRKKKKTTHTRKTHSFPLQNNSQWKIFREIELACYINAGGRRRLAVFGGGTQTKYLDPFISKGYHPM